MASFETPPVVLFASATSPVSRRLAWYLTLRGIPYIPCPVDNKMPRPVLARLGLKYRRLPVLAVGRDLYCDSRNIIQTLEEHYPIPRLGANPDQQPYDHAMEKILETWALENLFRNTSAMIPYDTLLARGPEWLKDRQQMIGRPFTKEALESIRPDVLATARVQLNTVEAMLKDGRNYIGGMEPGLADVHLFWAFDWMILREEGAMRVAYPELLDEGKFPSVFAWIKRLDALVAEKKREKSIERFGEDQTVELVEKANFWESENLKIVEWDPTGFERGTKIDLYTTDVPSGAQNKDTGDLLGLTDDNVTIGGKTKNGVDVRIHYPRLNIKIARAS